MVLNRFVFIVCAIVSLASAARGAEIPPAVARAVDFQKDVVPIFQASCVTCHSSGKTEADLSIETKAKLLEGGASEPAIVPGKSAESLLIQLVSGQDPDRIMPEKGKRLTAEQIGVLRAWIDQGAKWEPADFVLADLSKPTPAKLEPREVAIPPAKDGLNNPIDRLLEPYFIKHKITPGEVVDDRVFARRVYLDIIGLLPPPAALEAFVADARPNKRAILVRKLLDDNPRYAAHWLSFWNDLLRNDYKGTGYVDGGRKQITPWLYQALYDNMKYDQFVRELVTGANGSDGFIKGIVWRGVVNGAQTPQMQAAQNISQVFMGVNLKCASCHDSFINQWKLTDSYGFASVYADSPLEMERCEKPLGEKAPVKFLYSQLGSIPPDAPREKRVAALAEIVTSKGNGRFTRTIVNRLWQRFMGRGLIEPVDEMDYKPWNADVLDALAWDLPKHYDLKKTIEMIVLSRAYQLPAVPADESQKEYVFAGPTVRRMTAEQFVDSVATVTGVWPAAPAASMSAEQGKHRKSRWIWSVKGAEKTASAGTVIFRRSLQVDPSIKKAEAIIAVDNTFELHVNGKKVAEGADSYQKPVIIDLTPHIRGGKTVFRIVATNTPPANEKPTTAAASEKSKPEAATEKPNPPAASEKPTAAAASEKPKPPTASEKPKPAASREKPTTAAASEKPKRAATEKSNPTTASEKPNPAAASEKPNPAGIWFHLDAIYAKPVLDAKGREAGDLASDAKWEVSTDDGKTWAAAVDIGGVNVAPWSLADKLPSAWVVEPPGEVRAVLLYVDPLTSALGRPNREQVNTVRPTAATTLQMLELTNGATLAELLSRGAKKFAGGKDAAADDVIGAIYARALGRSPTEGERATAREVIGAQTVSPQGVEDLLWAVMMLPEFQLIR